MIVPAAVLTCLWAVATHLPKPEDVGLDVAEYDWLAHAAGYAVMAACWLLWLLSRPGAAPARSAGLAWALLALYGIADEATQPLVGRSAQWGDWVSDVVGAGMAAAAILLVWRRVSRRRPGRSGEEEVLDEVHDRVHVAERHP